MTKKEQEKFAELLSKQCTIGFDLEIFIDLISITSGKEKEDCIKIYKNLLEEYYKLEKELNPNKMLKYISSFC